MINKEQDSKRSIRLHGNINISRFKKLKEGKEVGSRMGIKENISLSVSEDKSWRPCPNKSRLSSSYCKQQKCHFLEPEAECLEKLRSGL